MKRKLIKTFDEHLDKRYGELGCRERSEFEIKAKSFAISEIKIENKLFGIRSIKSLSSLKK